MPFQKSAGAIVFRRNKDGVKYLLLKNDYSKEYWDVPKGLIEKGESLEVAAKREIREEAGLEAVDFVPGFKETMTYFYKTPEGTMRKEVVLFLAESKSGEVKISWEHTGFEWVDFDTAMSRMRKQQKEALSKANRFLAGGLKKFL
jgi:8-oxo-dGTP pyrophosphatase MutT (NUDIX family)